MTTLKQNMHTLTGRLFHWGTGVLLVYGFVRNGETTGVLFDPDQMRAEIIFTSLLAVLFILRYLWMHTANDGPTRLSVAAPNWERYAAKAVHAALYVGVASIIASGYAIAYFASAGGNALSISILIHNAAAHTTLSLTILHVAGAMWHWVIRRDGVWWSMLWKRKSAES